MDFSGVNRRRDSHIYQQIAAVIEAAIASGELAPGDAIPSEQHIMDATGASRWAVRHAVEYLREKGVIYTVPHLASYVSRDAPPPG